MRGKQFEATLRQYRHMTETGWPRTWISHRDTSPGLASRTSGRGYSRRRPCTGSLSEDTNLALGKYARVASAETTVHGFAPQKMSPSASSLAAEKFSSWICW